MNWDEHRLDFSASEQKTRLLPPAFVSLEGNGLVSNERFRQEWVCLSRHATEPHPSLQLRLTLAPALAVCLARLWIFCSFSSQVDSVSWYRSVPGLPSGLGRTPS